jgi:protein TonB
VTSFPEDYVMSDPMNRQTGIPPEESLPRKTAAPLLWLLVLVALLALGWYFYNRRPVETLPPQVPPAAATNPTASAEAPAAARSGTARRADRKPAPRPTVADRDPQPLARIQPEYPAQAFRAREEGTVVVRVDIDASGTPTNADIARRSGSRELDRAAVDAVRKWQFKPALRDGKAIASTVEVPVEFRLDRQ